MRGRLAVIISNTSITDPSHSAGLLLLGGLRARLRTGEIDRPGGLRLRRERLQVALVRTLAATVDDRDRHSDQHENTDEDEKHPVDGDAEPVAEDVLEDRVHVADRLGDVCLGLRYGRVTAEDQEKRTDDDASGDAEEEPVEVVDGVTDHPVEEAPNVALVHDSLTISELNSGRTGCFIHYITKFITLAKVIYHSPVNERLAMAFKSNPACLPF